MSESKKTIEQLAASSSYVVSQRILHPHENGILTGEPGGQYSLIASNLDATLTATIYASNGNQWLFYHTELEPNQSKQGTPNPFQMNNSGMVRIWNTTPEDVNGRPAVSFRLRRV